MSKAESESKKEFTERVEQKVLELLGTWRGHNAHDVQEGAEEPEKVEITRKTLLQGEYGKGGLGFDNLDCVEAIMTLEDYFEVVVCDEEADKIKTVGDLIRAISDTPYKANGKNFY